jgi:ferric enterobactin receptor
MICKKKSALFLLPVFFLFSQITAQNIIIRGVIIEKRTRSPIEFASVSLTKKGDSAAFTGTLSQPDGVFILPRVDAGAYLLKIVSLGYQTAVISVSIVRNSRQFNLDSVELNLSEKILNDVAVSARNIAIANKLDRQTYKAAQFESAKGGNAVDVLKNLPSVAVDHSGEISVRGSTGFLVLINGKPVLTDPQTILSQLPANTIETIELITAPSAKYDADGKAGIINITTKKGAADGMGVQANVQAGLPSTTNYKNLENPQRIGADATFSFKKDKWDISASGNYTRTDVNGRREGGVYTLNFVKNTITRFPSNGERSFDRYNYGGRAAISFTPNKNNVFNIGFFTSVKYQQRRADILYNNSTADLTTGAVLKQFTYFNSNVQTKEGQFTLGSFDLTHTFKDNSTLSATAMYEYADLFGNTINKNLDYPGKSLVFQEVRNPYVNPIKGYRVKLDYTAPIGKGRLEMGYQFRNDDQAGRFDYTVTPAAIQPDSARFRGTAKSTNQVNSVYGQYASKISKLQYIAGFRYEFTAREVTLSSDTRPHTLKLGNLFPSANLQYSFNAAWNAKAGYSKRIQRNNNFELNPIPEREHSETLEQGDPDLLPQFIDLLELGVTHVFKTGSVFSTLYYQHIRNPVQRVNSVYADTILNRLFTNADKARLIGLETAINFKPVKWLSAYLGANMYNYRISGGLNVLGNISTVNNAAWVYSLTMNLGFNLARNWNLQMNANYISARPTAQGEDSRFFSPNTSLKKTLKDGKYTVGLQWQNMNMGFMNSNKQRITTFGKDFYTTTNYILETDVFMINFSVNINRLSSKTRLPASELGEKEF